MRILQGLKYIQAKVKKNYYYVVCVVELLVLLVGGIKIARETPLSFFFGSDTIFADTADGRWYGNYLGEENAGEVQFLRTEEMQLEKGIYRIVVNVSSTDGGTISVAGEQTGPKSLWADNVGISKYDTSKAFYIWANDKIGRFQVQIFSNGGTLIAEDVVVQTARVSNGYKVVCLLLKLVLLNGIVAVYFFRRRLQKYSIVIAGIAGIALLSSLGVLMRYMLPGHDLNFHLMRIEGLKEGLLSGVFPVRIQSNWCNGWGYAVSIMYGDTSLFLPAIMRILGFTIQTSYKTFVIVINILTALIAWYSFEKMCGNKKIALLGSFLYTMSPYRLCCIYIRGAFGEYTAMMFLPIVLLGFWYVFYEDGEKKSGSKVLTLTIGLSGLIQTHILTCQMVAVFVVLGCIVYIKKVLNKNAIIYFVKVLVLTVLANLWFIIPFLRYYKEPLICTSFTEMHSNYQIYGVSLTELLALESSGFYDFSWAGITSLANKFSAPLGNGLLLCAVFSMLALWNQKIQEESKGVKVLLVGGVLATWLATNLFPYHNLQEYLPAVASFLGKVQFPYRYLSISCLLLTAVGVLAFSLTKKTIAKNIYVAIITGVVLISAVQSMGYIYQTIYGGSYELHYDSNSLYSNYLMGNEYLYEGAESWLTEIDRIAGGEGISIINSTKETNSMVVKCKTTAGDAYLEVPIFYYPGYVAVDENNNSYTVERGNNSRIRVTLPNGFEGKITVNFKEPLLWRVGEIISLLTMMGMVMFYFINRRKSQLQD